MPIPLSLAERIGIVHLNEGPGPMLDLAGALATRAISTALRLGIFEALADRGQSAAEFASSLPGDLRGVQLLLDALVATGYLRVDSGQYTLSAMSRTWMLSTSPRAIADVFPYMEDALDRWATLDQAIRQGHPAQIASQWLYAHDGAWARYDAGMRAIARMVGPEVVRRTQLRGNPKRLLDVGGSHGLYSVLFCEAVPGLAATVLDREGARPAAESTFRASKANDRVHFEAGELATWTAPHAFDVVLAFNLIRLFKPDVLTVVLSQLIGLLQPGGQLVILDEFGGGPPGTFADANHRLVRLELYNSTVGQSYRPAEVAPLLTEAGFTGVRHVRLRRAGGLGLLMATRPLALPGGR